MNGTDSDDRARAPLPPVEIPAFSGPLDLLLHLIRVNEVSITDIPIAEITEQYTAYLDAMRELDLDVASDYIALAAELIYVKSQMLLPRAPGEPGRIRARPRAPPPRVRAIQAGGGVVPRDRLSARRPVAAAADGVPHSPDGETLEVSLFDLIDTSATSRTATASRTRRRGDPPPALLRRREDAGARGAARRGRGALPLLEFLGQMRFRAEAVTAFLATLELIRLGVVPVFQAAAFGEIHADRTEAAFSPEQMRDTYR